MSPEFYKPHVFELDKEEVFDDGLSVRLRSFSHKRSSTTGPRKATAYFDVSTPNQQVENLMISIHSPAYDHAVEYETVEWGSYTFELQDFLYDARIIMCVKKKI